MKTLKDIWFETTHGSVQGVAYNAFTKSQAILSGLLIGAIAYGSILL